MLVKHILSFFEPTYLGTNLAMFWKHDNSFAKNSSSTMNQPTKRPLPLNKLLSCAHLRVPAQEKEVSDGVDTVTEPNALLAVA
jgi:hypothetical protein